MAARGARRAQPWRLCAVAQGDFGEQHLPHAFELMHMLVAVDECRRKAECTLERVQLGPHFAAYRGQVELLQPGLCDQQRQGTARTRQKGPLGEVQMQADVDAVAREAAHAIEPLAAPRIAADHAADRVYAAFLRQAQGCVVHALMQTEVVDGDADARPAAMLVRSMNDASAPQRIARFIAVGCAAAAVHWLIVVGLVGNLQWRPLVANVIGWLVAFGVSFGGHHALTFRGHGLHWLLAARRFFIVSAVGFVINESSYAVLRGATGVRFDVLLALVIAAVAVLTYLLGRHWAFLRS